MRSFRSPLALCVVVSTLPVFLACSSGDDDSAGTGGSSSGAAAGTGGSGGTSTTGGSAGMTAGGSSGASSGGSAGQSGAASGGSATTGGSAGTMSAGRGGAGMSGMGAGGAGTAGSGAMSGSGGTGVAGGGASGGASGGTAGGTSGSAGTGMASGGSGGASGVFTVTNPDFMNVAGCSETMQSVCDTFPRELASYMNGPNVSPELDWTNVPAGTQSFAVLLQDLVNGQAHWALWNIPGSATMLAADVPKTSNMPATPAGSQQTSASFASGDGYFGPGSACNVYEYKVYALATAKFTPASTTDANAVRTALDALDASTLLGTASIRGRQAACSNGQMCNASNMCAN